MASDEQARAIVRAGGKLEYDDDLIGRAAIAAIIALAEKGEMK